MAEFATTAAQFAFLQKARTEDRVSYIIDYLEITEVVQRYGRSVDMHDFELLRTCYGDEIDVDHSPTIGMGQMRISADKWCAMAKRFHSQLDGGEHILIPQGIVINGETAFCHVLVHASHFYRGANGSPFQILVGSYDLSFKKTDDGWKISESTQGMRWTEGNWQFHEEIKASLAESTDE